jgi:outer membrane protein assembly factor BamB
VREFNTEVPPWYAGQCPLIDGDRLILGTGGDALVVAVDCGTGAVLWRSPNPRNWQMTHSSLTPMEFQGRRMYVYCGSGGVAGVSAADGAILWDTTDWKISIATIPSPLPVGDGRIFLCGGYNAGSLMLRLKEAGGAWAAESLFRLKPAVFGAVQQTPILYREHLLGVRPDGQLACLDLKGKSVWEWSFSHGPGDYLSHGRFRRADAGGGFPGGLPATRPGQDPAGSGFLGAHGAGRRAFNCARHDANGLSRGFAPMTTTG